MKIVFDDATVEKALHAYRYTHCQINTTARHLDPDWQAVVTVFADAANAQLAEPKPLFEVGKRYRRRDGVIEKLEATHYDIYVFLSAGTVFTWTAEGKYWRDIPKHPHDLMPGAIEDDAATAVLSDDAAHWKARAERAEAINERVRNEIERLARNIPPIGERSEADLARYSTLHMICGAAKFTIHPAQPLRVTLPEDEL